MVGKGNQRNKVKQTFEFKSLLTASVHNDIKKLYLSFLYILEELQQRGKISPMDYQIFRKRILDFGNDTSREVIKQIEAFIAEIEVHNERTTEQQVKKAPEEDEDQRFNR